MKGESVMRKSKALYPSAFRQQIIEQVGPKYSRRRRAQPLTPSSTAAPNGARFLGKGYGLVCRKRREDTHTLFELMMTNQAEFPVQILCRVLNVSRSAGNSHATFCGNRGRVTASGLPGADGEAPAVYSPVQMRIASN